MASTRFGILKIFIFIVFPHLQLLPVGVHILLRLLGLVQKYDVCFNAHLERHPVLVDSVSRTATRAPN